MDYDLIIVPLLLLANKTLIHFIFPEGSFEKRKTLLFCMNLIYVGALSLIMLKCFELPSSTNRESSYLIFCAGFSFSVFTRRVVDVSRFWQSDCHEEQELTPTKEEIEDNVMRMITKHGFAVSTIKRKLLCAYRQSCYKHGHQVAHEDSEHPKRESHRVEMKTFNKKGNNKLKRSKSLESAHVHPPHPHNASHFLSTWSLSRKLLFLASTRYSELFLGLLYSSTFSILLLSSLICSNFYTSLSSQSFFPSFSSPAWLWAPYGDLFFVVGFVLSKFIKSNLFFVFFAGAVAEEGNAEILACELEGGGRESRNKSWAKVAVMAAAVFANSVLG